MTNYCISSDHFIIIVQQFNLFSKFIYWHNRQFQEYQVLLRSIVYIINSSWVIQECLLATDPVWSCHVTCTKLVHAIHSACAKSWMRGQEFTVEIEPIRGQQTFRTPCLTILVCTIVEPWPFVYRPTSTSTI